MNAHVLRGKILHYNIYETLGQGTTSKVKYAEDTTKSPTDPNFKVAIKILRQNVPADFQEAIISEVKTMVTIPDHPNV